MPDSVEVAPKRYPISSLDGRDARLVDDLRPFVTEFALFQNRSVVGAMWLRKLGEVLPALQNVSPTAWARVDSWISGDSFSDADYEAIKDIELGRNGQKATKHDLNALVRYYTELLRQDPETSILAPYYHYGQTSEDVNNLAEGIGLSGARSNVILPTLQGITTSLHGFGSDWADIPLLARTHGQAASPTTLGKEMEVFAERLEIRTEKFADVDIYGKHGGATGAHNALHFLQPDVNWRAVSRSFVRDLGFKYMEATTQIEPHDGVVDYLHSLGHASIILVDLSDDMWSYISRNLITQLPDGDGSSTMPNKINPINWEKARANILGGMAMNNHLSMNLPISRLQRDLSDSSAKRMINPAIAHIMVGLREIQTGSGKIAPNEARIREELNDDWSILAEPLQLLLKEYGIDGYDLVKEMTQGLRLHQQDWLSLIETRVAPLIPPEALQKILELAPWGYTGYSADIARRTTKEPKPAELSM